MAQRRLSINTCKRTKWADTQYGKSTLYLIFKHKWCWIFRWTSGFIGPTSTAHHFLTRWTLTSHFSQVETEGTAFGSTFSRHNYFYFLLLISNIGKWHGPPGESVLKLYPGRNQCLRGPSGILEGQGLAEMTQWDRAGEGGTQSHVSWHLY